MSDHPRNHGGGNGFEREDLGGRPVYAFIISLVVSGILIYYVLWGMFHFLDAYERKQHSSGRNLGSWLLRMVNTWIFHKPPGLVMSSFRCLRRELVDALLANHTRYPVIGPLILGSTRRIENVTVRHDPRKHGRSNYSLPRLVRATLDNILSFSSLPLQIISVAGVCISFLSFAMGGAYAIAHFVRGGGVPGWTSLFLAVNFYAGLGLLSVGIAGEYLVRIIGESRGQPLYVVRRRLEGGSRE